MEKKEVRFLGWISILAAFFAAVYFNLTSFFSSHGTKIIGLAMLATVYSFRMLRWLPTVLVKSAL